MSSTKQNLPSFLKIEGALADYIDTLRQQPEISLKAAAGELEPARATLEELDRQALNTASDPAQAQLSEAQRFSRYFRQQQDAYIVAMNNIVTTLAGIEEISGDGSRKQLENRLMRAAIDTGRVKIEDVFASLSPDVRKHVNALRGGRPSNAITDGSQQVFERLEQAIKDYVEKAKQLVPEPDQALALDIQLLSDYGGMMSDKRKQGNMLSYREDMEIVGKKVTALQKQIPDLGRKGFDEVFADASDFFRDAGADTGNIKRAAAR